VIDYGTIEHGLRYQEDEELRSVGTLDELNDDGRDNSRLASDSGKSGIRT
jgi:hypothetical protein